MKLCGMLSRMFLSMIDVSHVRRFHIHLEPVWMMFCLGGHHNVWKHNIYADPGFNILWIDKPPRTTHCNPGGKTTQSINHALFLLQLLQPGF